MLRALFPITLAFLFTNAWANSDIASSCSGNYQKRINCQNTTEKKIIDTYPSLVQRNNDELILKPIKSNNPPKILVNKELIHTVVAHYHSQNISLIKVEGHEYFNSYIYHHLYGTYREVFGEINFSKDGKYMVAYNADIEAGFSPNAVAVFRLGSWPTILSSFQNMEFGITNAKFTTSNEISLNTIFFNRESKNGYAHGKCILKKYGSIWQFEKLNCTNLNKQ